MVIGDVTAPLEAVRFPPRQLPQTRTEASAGLAAAGPTLWGVG